MFTQTEIVLIDSIDSMPESIRFSKLSCLKLFVIKEKYDGKQDIECFCTVVRRKIWYKDFMIWYENSLRQVY